LDCQESVHKYSNFFHKPFQPPPHINKMVTPLHISIDLLSCPFKTFGGLLTFLLIFKRCRMPWWGYDWYIWYDI